MKVRYDDLRKVEKLLSLVLQLKLDATFTYKAINLVFQSQEIVQSLIYA